MSDEEQIKNVGLRKSPLYSHKGEELYHVHPETLQEGVKLSYRMLGQVTSVLIAYLSIGTLFFYLVCLTYGYAYYDHLGIRWVAFELSNREFFALGIGPFLLSLSILGFITYALYQASKFNRDPGLSWPAPAPGSRSRRAAPAGVPQLCLTANWTD